MLPRLEVRSTNRKQTGSLPTHPAQTTNRITSQTYKWSDFTSKTPIIGGPSPHVNQRHCGDAEEEKVHKHCRLSPSSRGQY